LVNGELVDNVLDKVELKEGEKAEQRNKVSKPIKFTWYPLSKNYSKIYNYPKDIKDDWKEGIEETRRLLEEDGIKV